MFTDFDDYMIEIVGGLVMFNVSKGAFFFINKKFLGDVSRNTAD